MLPYTIFMIKAIFAAGTLEISISRVLDKGFAFFAGNLPEQLYFEATFFDRAQRKYDSMRLSQFALRRIGEEWELTTGDIAFLQRWHRLLKEYSGYIDIKLSNDENELLRALTGKGFQNKYSESLASWRSEMLGAAQWEKPLLECELAVVLDTPELWNGYLNAGVSEVWKLYGLENHPIARVPVTHIYVGSQFCPELFPDDAVLTRLLNAQHTPVVCFPPMPERMTDEYLRRARLLQKDCEVVINDIGTALMLKDTPLKLTAGVLMAKRLKDPRLSMRIHSEADEEAAYTCAIDSGFYSGYLENLGITRFSYETCGFPVNIKPGSVMHLPLYQTNTAVNPCKNCDLCTGCRFYPDDMKLIGRGNSLFGFSDEINSVDTLNGMIWRGAVRLAVRL